MMVESSGAVAVERNERFWRTAYDEHGPAVLGFLLRRLRQRDEAEDLLQETFVRAIRVDTFDGENLRGYLLCIARNLLVNRLRRPRRVVPVETPEGAQPFEEVASPAVSPEREAEWTVFQARLDDALARLSADHRRAFELAVLEQHSYAEIVRLTGWSLPRVKSNVHRARKQLIERLGAWQPAARGSAG